MTGSPSEENGRSLCRIDRVAADPASRIVADVLAHTALADPTGTGDDAAHWVDSGVLDATERVISRLTLEGFLRPAPEKTS